MSLRHDKFLRGAIKIGRPFRRFVPERLTPAIVRYLTKANVPMNVTNYATTLDRFRSEFSDVEGFVIPATEVVWDFLLTAQNNIGITGNAFEIGVYKGRTTYLAALYLNKNEKIMMVDLHNLSGVGGRLRSMGIENFIYEGKSSNITINTFREYLGTVRWFHIDGDHSGYSTANDLALAAMFLGDRGVICVDDFMNEIYPQLCAEVYRFLFQNPTFKMVLSGRGKCYICRSEDYAFYDACIRDGLARHVHTWDAGVIVSKTSYAHDMGNWTVSAGQSDGINKGRDSAPLDVPF